jgi:circadian clock protein KaiC
VADEISTRRLRVLKYRGSLHGTNEYPFLIGESGISVQPLTTRGLQHAASSERISTGVARLDSMLGDGGLYVGSTTLVSGTAGTGKSTLAAQLCDAACERGERVIYFAFEESEADIVRNMASVGLDLQPWIDTGLLTFSCFRPSLLGLEAHLFAIQQMVIDIEPSMVVKDPVSALFRLGTRAEVTAMLIRQIDFLKDRGVTTVFTSLSQELAAEGDHFGLGSLVDTWLLLKTTEGNGEHNRLLYVRKARGLAHSNQIREFLVTASGIELADVYVGPQGVLTGSARQAQEAKELADGVIRREDLEQRQVDLARKRAAVEADVAALWRDFAAEVDVVERLLTTGSTGTEGRADQRAEQGRMRHADAATVTAP